MNSATENRACPSCGAVIPANAPEGICPKCLMAAAAVATDAGQTGGKRPEPPSLERLAAAFPQLDVLEFIGQGGMGAVYKARQKQLDRIVALKVLPPGIGGDPSFAERFTREAKALAKLLHPNIVALFEFGQADGIYYLLMEYVDGVSLGQLLRSSRVSAREALAIVPQICDALQFAHDQGIVHRDIKPENILLDRRGRVKVADFGLAKLVQVNAPLSPSLSPSDGERVAAKPGEGKTPALTAAGKVMGTPNYMAPEQVEHPAEVDHRADIYALGVVFYQMLTGELPGKSMEPPSKKVQIDVRLDEVVLRALEQNPQLRYQQVSEVKTLVETIVATPPSSSRREEDQTEAARPRQNWWTWWLFQSPEAGRICAHLTKEERKHLLVLLLLYSVWVMATIFGIPALNGHMRDVGSGDWIVTAVWAGLFIVSLPMIDRMMRHFFCSTDWARKQGITPGKLRLFSFSARPVETILISENTAAPSTGQVEEQRSKVSWIGTLPKLNGPFVVMRGNRRMLNWPAIGFNVGMGLAMICVVLRIMDSSMSFHGNRANLILLFGLFAVAYIVRGWRDSLTALEAQSAKPGVPLAPARGRDYRTRQSLFGLPLVHVAWGIDPATGRPRTAKGIVAVGPAAIGVIAVGFSAWGLLPCGLVAGGLLPFGLLFAVGFAAVGLVAAGGQAVGLCAVGFWHAVGLVAAGPTAIGLERVLVGRDVLLVPFVLVFVAACLTDWLICAIGSATALTAGVARRKGLEGASDPARAAAPRASQGIRVARTIGSIAAVLVCVLLFGATWFRQLAARNGQWEPRAIRPSPTALQNPLACLRVTDVSREGNIILFRIVSAAGFPAHLLTAEFRGPGIPIMPGAYGSYHYNGPDLSCLLGPDETAAGYADGTHFTGNNLTGWLELVSGKRKVSRMGNRQYGPGEFLYGFYLPDTELAEMAMKQGREVCLGKTNYLGSGASVLLLFDFKRFAGKDAAGKDIWQSLTASLGVTPDFDAARRHESK
jgi:serine/threonine protein kinase